MKIKYLNVLILNIIKWGIFLSAFIVLLIVSLNNRASNVDFEIVKQKVYETTQNEKMQPGDNRMIKRLYGIETSEFENTALFYPSSNMDAEELFLVRLKERSQKDEIVSAIQKRLDTQKRNFEGYGADQTRLLNSSVIKVHGKDVIYIVSENASDVVKIFENTL